MFRKNKPQEKPIPETNFSCKTCQKTFKHESSLSRHSRQHKIDIGLAAKFKCGTCSKEFVDIRNLKRHEFLHTSEARCNFCDCRVKNHKLVSNYL